MRGNGAVSDYFAAAETLEAGGELVGIKDKNLDLCRKQ